jgi:hypothetical protein
MAETIDEGTAAYTVVSSAQELPVDRFTRWTVHHCSKLDTAIGIARDQRSAKYRRAYLIEPAGDITLIAGTFAERQLGMPNRSE